MVRPFLLSLAACGALLSVRYFSFAYQGLINRHILAHKRRAFDVDEAIGQAAVSEGWRMLLIACLILLVAIGIGIFAYRYEEDV